MGIDWNSVKEKLLELLLSKTPFGGPIALQQLLKSIFGFDDIKSALLEDNPNYVTMYEAKTAYVTSASTSWTEFSASTPWTRSAGTFRKCP